MMKTFFLILALSLSLPAQNEFVGKDMGTGARGIAMAGAHTALASDFSSVYWNPAGLNRIRLHELSVSLQSLALENKSSYNGGNTFESSLSDVILSSIGYVHPVPTSQGSLVFAAGFTRPQNLSYVQAEPGGTFTALGHLSRWNLAAGLAFSPSVSFGMNFFLNTGQDEALLKHDYPFNLPLEGGDSVLCNTESDVGDFIGYGLNAGFLFDLTERFSLGLAGLLYNRLNSERKQEYLLNSDAVATGDKKNISILNPFSVSAGLAYKTLPLCLEMNAAYTFWEQSKYYLKDFDTPLHVPDLQNTLDIAFGIEGLVPMPFKKMPGLLVRGGFCHGQLPYSSYESKLGRNSLSGGVGILFDQSLLLEFSIVYTLIKSDYFDVASISEESANTSGLLSIAYRY